MYALSEHAYHFFKVFVAQIIKKRKQTAEREKILLVKSDNHGLLDFRSLLHQHDFNYYSNLIFHWQEKAEKSVNRSSKKRQRTNTIYIPQIETKTKMGSVIDSLSLRSY